LVGIVTASAAQRISVLALDHVVAEIAVALQPFKKGDLSITATTDIAQDLNMDSLAVMDLLMELEDKFDVSIPLNMVPEIATVGQLAQTVIDSKKGA
jgi:acyl carrier protein